MTEAVRVPPIDLVVETGAEPELVWRTLTDPARVALWFTDASRVGRVGDTYRLDFGEGSVVRGEVLALEPGRTFAHAWAWDGSEPGEVTRVTWTVEPHLGGSRVRLVHDGWDEAGMDRSARDDHEGYWRGYLDDLRDVLEEA
ncbi:MAG TPA: SRPBCC domain-containing protein [Candidatus Limnocylindrales bacterium]|nr:SRPBCC domain-containing protein [Candidatus Limnocylindrales bacterium]